MREGGFKSSFSWISWRKQTTTKYFFIYVLRIPYDQIFVTSSILSRFKKKYPKSAAKQIRSIKKIIDWEVKNTIKYDIKMTWFQFHEGFPRTKYNYLLESIYWDGNVIVSDAHSSWKWPYEHSLSYKNPRLSEVASNVLENSYKSLENSQKLEHFKNF